MKPDINTIKQEIEEGSMRTIYLDGVKELATVDGGTKRPIENIHFTSENFDKLFNIIHMTLHKALDQVAHAVIEYCDKEVIEPDELVVGEYNEVRNDFRKSQREVLSLLEQQLK